MLDDEDIVRILDQSCNIAVVGLSPDPSRPSHRVSRYLQEAGYRILPVNPRCVPGEILGERVWKSLLEITEPIDVVDVFRRPEHLPALAAEALRTAAPVLWMQSGVESEEARALFTGAGRTVIADRCIMAEHMRLIAGTG